MVPQPDRDQGPPTPAPLLGAAVSLWFDILMDTSFLLFGFLLGATIYLLTHNSSPQKAKHVSLLVLLTAWSASLSVRSGRGRYQQAIAFGAVALDRIGEIDRGCVGTHADGFDRARRHQANNEGGQQRRCPRADHTQSSSSELHPRNLHRASPERKREQGPTVG